MPNSDRPEPTPPPTTVFETKPTITGYKLRGLAFHTPGGGIAIQLFRRTLLAPASAAQAHEQTWYIVASLAVYPPISIPEALRTYVAWLNSYDANLKEELGALQEALSNLHESAPATNGPQGPLN